MNKVFDKMHEFHSLIEEFSLDIIKSKVSNLKVITKEKVVWIRKHTKPIYNKDEILRQEIIKGYEKEKRTSIREIDIQISSEINFWGPGYFVNFLVRDEKNIIPLIEEAKLKFSNEIDFHKEILKTRLPSYEDNVILTTKMIIGKNFYTMLSYNIDTIFRIIDIF